jgi:hypothetical protein
MKAQIMQKYIFALMIFVKIIVSYIHDIDSKSEIFNNRLVEYFNLSFPLTKITIRAIIK